MAYPTGRIRNFGGVEYTKPGWSNHVRLQAPDTEPSTGFTLKWFNALPGSTQAITVDSSGQLGLAALSGGGGTVTSVGLSLPSIFTVTGSPVTTTGTLIGTLSSQSANTVFAGPTSGGSAAPTFRSLVYADVSTLVGTTANTLCAGNDSRIHNQNTDTGTSAVSFQLDNTNAGPRLKADSGTVVALRNAADNAYASLIVQDLTVQGTTTTVNSETVTIADNNILLNSNFTTGSPTENGGITISRGSSTDALLEWDESADRWAAGLVGSTKPLARVHTQSFVNADLVGGVLTVTHNLGSQYNCVQVYSNDNLVVLPDEIAATSANVTSLDLASYGTLTGTWRVVIIGG